MTLAFVDIGSCGRVPAKSVTRGRPPCASDTCRAVDERVVIDLCTRTVKDHHAVIAIHKDIPRHDDAFRDFEEKAVVARPELICRDRLRHMTDVLYPVIDEHAVYLADVVPDAVRIRKIGNEIIAACHAMTLIENLHSCRIIPGYVLDVIAHEDVAFQEHVVRSDDVDALRAGVADLTVTERQAVSAEISGDAGAI